MKESTKRQDERREASKREDTKRRDERAMVGEKTAWVRVRRWVLLTADRWIIAGSMLFVVFLSTFGLAYTDFAVIRNQDFVTRIFQLMIGGLLSLVPIIIAVNQLTISEIFATPTGLRRKIDSVHAFRTDLEEMMEGNQVSPTEPARFVATVLEIVSQRATSLRKSCPEPDSELNERLDNYADTIVRQQRDVHERLDGSHLPIIEVLLPMMGDVYSENINIARRIQSEYAETMTQQTDELLHDLRELFIDMDIIRQYFKAIYIQQELAYLSRLMAYFGTVSFVNSLVLILLVTNGDPFPHHPILFQILISFGIMIGFSPFAVFVSIIVRIATIAKRTAAPGAFTPRSETPDYTELSK